MIDFSIFRKKINQLNKYQIFNEEDLIGQRTIGVYGKQRYELITTDQPFYINIIIVLALILLIISLAFLAYKKDVRYLVLFAVILMIFSLFLPWWEINGSTEPIETNTKLYLIPNEMITITITQDTIAGELSYLPPEFLDAITAMIFLTIAGCILFLFMFNVDLQKRILVYKLSKLFSVLMVLAPGLIFIIAMSELSKVGIGTIFGSGNLDIGVPGETQISSVICNWGLSIGFYLYAIAILILLILSIKIFIKRRGEAKMDKQNNSNKKNKRTIQHPLFGISFKNWIQLCEKNGGFDLKYIDRAAFITASTIFTAPIRTLFKLKYGSIIKESKIKNPPVFIIGHWRSGTTYLHELLSEDPQFCYVSLWNTMLPDSYPLLDPTRKFLANFLPKTRPMDSIEVAIDGPYEEEAGIAVINQWSFFHGLHFPKNAEEQYLKSIHYEGLSKAERDEWKTNYFDFMKTVTYTNDGKRLLLKNPANTARIPLLLELFPDAKFIHIYRSPYKVYLSTVKMRNRVLDKLALQEWDEEEIEKQVLENYKRLMNSFFEQKKLIPNENYVEVRYENLVKDPLKQVKKIYTKLKLPGFKKALPGMNEYLERKKDYKTNVYKIDKKIIDKVKKHWSFTIERWGYKPPE